MVQRGVVAHTAYPEPLAPVREERMEGGQGRGVRLELYIDRPDGGALYRIISRHATSTRTVRMIGP